MRRFIAIGIVSWFALGACGGPGHESNRPDSESLGGFLAPSANGRIKVAEVGGVPIYDECVASLDKEDTRLMSKYGSMSLKEYLPCL